MIGSDRLELILLSPQAIEALLEDRRADAEHELDAAIPEGWPGRARRRLPALPAEAARARAAGRAMARARRDPPRARADDDRPRGLPRAAGGQRQEGSGSGRARLHGVRATSRPWLRDRGGAGADGLGVRAGRRRFHRVGLADERAVAGDCEEARLRPDRRAVGRGGRPRARLRTLSRVSSYAGNVRNSTKSSASATRSNSSAAGSIPSRTASTCSRTWAAVKRPLLDPLPDLRARDLRGGGVFHQVVDRGGADAAQPGVEVADADGDVRAQAAPR